MQTLCLDHLEKGVKSLSVCISSLGGDVNAGLGLYNFLRMLPIEVHTQLRIMHVDRRDGIPGRIDKNRRIKFCVLNACSHLF